MSNIKFPPRLFVSPCRMADVWNGYNSILVSTIKIQLDTEYLSLKEHEHLLAQAVADQAAKYIKIAEEQKAELEGTLKVMFR